MINSSLRHLQATRRLSYPVTNISCACLDGKMSRCSNRERLSIAIYLPTIGDIACPANRDQISVRSCAVRAD